MKEIFFKCELLSDVVVNASLATEGNIQSLDYIAGSKFLGIVAKKLYDKSGAEDSYNLFHSDKISFGDANISKGESVSYAIPFSLFIDKNNNNIIEDDVWLHHEIINKPINGNDNQKQLKQIRIGYFDNNNHYYPKTEKNFSLKSAHDVQKRRSKEAAMYGYESLKKGQLFLFSVRAEDEMDFDTIKNALIGTQQLGKSKTSEFGQVEITEIKISSEPGSEEFANHLIVYAESNLCFFNNYGQSTFQPEAEDFGIKGGQIDWTKSQIRTYIYTPWNGKRNTTSSQRDCILKGSVFYIKPKANMTLETSEKKQIVGEYIAEGLGRIIYNPGFLSATDDGKWKIKLIRIPEAGNIRNGTIENVTPIAKFLSAKKDAKGIELETGIAVTKFIKDYREKFSDISNSQWGTIRSIAVQSPNVDALKVALFGHDETKKLDNAGYLMNGVASEKYWDTNKGARRRILLQSLIAHRNLGTAFIAKLAIEIAKLNDENKPETKNG